MTMTKEALLAMPVEDAKGWMEKAAAWASEWCVGATDQPRFMAPKVLSVMCLALEEGQDPIEAMNGFLGTDFSYEVLNA